MNEVVMIFPHQLLKQHPALQKNRQVYLVEEWLFFRQYNFHQQKLVLHRSCMKFYEAYLKKQNYTVHYIDTTDERNEVRKLITFLSQQKITCIHIADVVDYWLTKLIRAACKKNSIKLTVYASPSFLNTMDEVAEYFSKKKTYFHSDFYIYQRKQRKILLEANGKPTGGKWTFDADNRMKFSKKEVVPTIQFPETSTYIAEAIKYVQQHFSENYGTADAPHFFVASFKEAEEWLSDFLINRFEKFGIYEDAIVADESILHHSVLTPMLNSGLLTPQQIVDAVLNHAKKYTTPLNSIEGFIRQIIGWREFIRIIYERQGSKQRTTNYWKFKRKIPKSFWTGTTGITPLDITIRKVLQTGYCHHIERLMVLGNFMLLCEFDPDEVYQWFMELFIDAYDWVMVPNVYGMTQFADGGLMTTKPYISGSNYLMKMSNYEKGDWQQVWDGLFWRFMHVHRNFFLQNPRLGMLVGTFDKMSEEKRNSHLVNAEKYLSSL
ncbi:MAG: cryptochrome/photolyase family protein [Chitinophagaceae bacterium]